MKTFICVSLLFMSSLVSVLAQGVGFGLRAGVNLANASYESGSFSADPDMKAGVQVGVYLKAMFTDKFGIQPEVSFSTQGFKIDAGSLGKYEEKLVYVNIPVLLRYNIVKFVNIHLGPQFGLLTSAKSVSGSSTTDIKENLKSSDLSAVAGVGLDLPMGISAGLRYSLGLSDIDKNDSAGESLKNRVLQIYVGYKLFGNK